MPLPERGELEPRAEGLSIEALFRAHHAALCGFAYRYVLSPDVAEEWGQEVFLYLWEHDLQCPYGTRGR